MPASPALVLHFPAGAAAADRDRLLVRLVDFDLLAIHEDDVTAPATWVAHFTTAAARDAARSALAGTAGLEGIRIEEMDVPDEDWARRTQADLPAIRIGRVVVAPPWDLPGAGVSFSSAERRAPGAEVNSSSAERRAPRADVLVEIEPSRGFGTGHHQSTRLCLVLLQARDLAGRTVIDVGTGSGVLAIAAAKLGAAFVSAIDVDPDAVDNARENIARNGVGATVEAHVRDVQDASVPAADVVTANLTGRLLAKQADALGRFVKPSGALIAAGFTADERVLVEHAFAPAFAISESAEEDGWWAFVLTRGG